VLNHQGWNRPDRKKAPEQTNGGQAPASGAVEKGWGGGPQGSGGTIENGRKTTFSKKKNPNWPKDWGGGDPQGMSYQDGKSNMEVWWFKTKKGKGPVGEEKKSTVQGGAKNLRSGQAIKKKKVKAMGNEKGRCHREKKGIGAEKKGWFSFVG